MIKIDGTEYNVPVISIKRTADFLDKFATRTESGDLQRELIGVYFNYQPQFGSTLTLMNIHPCGLSSQRQQNFIP